MRILLLYCVPLLFGQRIYFHYVDWSQISEDYLLLHYRGKAEENLPKTLKSTPKYYRELN